MYAEELLITITYAVALTDPDKAVLPHQNGLRFAAPFKHRTCVALQPFHLRAYLVRLSEGLRRGIIGRLHRKSGLWFEDPGIKESLQVRSAQLIS